MNRFIVIITVLTLVYISSSFSLIIFVSLIVVLLSRRLILQIIQVVYC
jgi:hypothetical protein